MIAWYSRSWDGSLGHVQRKLLPELDRLCGVVFDDDVTPTHIPNRPEWLDEMFARSAVADRPKTCVVFGAEWDVTPPLASRYEKVFIYCTSRWTPDVPPLAGKIARFIVPSHWAQEQLDDARRKISAVVPHGVDLELFRPAERRESGPVKVLTVTSASRPSKRLDRVIACFTQAFPKDEPATLTVKIPSGVVYYGRHLLDLDVVKRLVNDDRVTFLPGPMPEEELAELYRRHDVFAYASEWETFGLSVAEARACGLALVISPVTALAEQLDGEDVEFSAERLRECGDGIASGADCRRFAAKTPPLSWAQSAEMLAEVLAE